MWSAKRFYIRTTIIPTLNQWSTTGIKHNKAYNIFRWYKLILCAWKHKYIISKCKYRTSKYMWLVSVNKLSLNNDKTKYIFSHKPSISDYISFLNCHLLILNNKIIKRSEHIRFLGIILDENLTWKKHINTIKK